MRSCLSSSGLSVLLTASAIGLLSACGSTSPDAPLGGGFPAPDAGWDTAVFPNQPDPETPDFEEPDAIDPVGPIVPPDGGAATPDAGPPALAVGGTAVVTAGALNLRKAAGTSAEVIDTMPCGSEVTLLASATGGWWKVRFASVEGFASGKYLVPKATFQPSVCGGVDPGPAPGDAGSAADEMFRLAKLGVGYSYYWGHGSWRSDGAEPGSCSGSCPSCTHQGKYGADCSGYVGKIWQIPKASPIETDSHPYSTYSFVHSQDHWHSVSRSDVQPADAFVYNENGAGHIFLYESGSDPWGSVWAYEARSCSSGIVHNLRKADSKYQVIRRNGM